MVMALIMIKAKGAISIHVTGTGSKRVSFLNVADTGLIKNSAVIPITQHRFS